MKKTTMMSSRSIGGNDAPPSSIRLSACITWTTFTAYCRIGTDAHVAGNLSHRAAHAWNTGGKKNKGGVERPYFFTLYEPAPQNFKLLNF
jgi:hypothetical protein